MTSATRAAKYRRISDDREGEELGVIRQDQDLDQLAASRGYMVVGDYPDDDISASTRSTKPRPAYERLIRDARAGMFEVILAYTSSRLTRRPRELEDLIELAEKHKIRFEYVRSPSFDLNTADGRQVARMLAASDAAEAERTGERVSRTRRQQAENGQYGGGRRPYGFGPDGMTMDPGEVDVIRDAADQIIRGGSLRGVSRDLNDREIPTVTGKPWTAETLRDILLRPRNAGRMVYRGEVIGTAPWDPIIPPDRYDTMVRILTDSTRDTRVGTAPRWLLSGIAQCGVCGDGTTVEITIGGRSPRYRCRKTPHVTRAQVSVDTLVVGIVLGLIRRDAPEVFNEPVPGVDVDALNRERETIEANLTRIGGDVALGLMTRTQGLDATRRGQARIAEIDIELATVHGPDPVIGELARARDPWAVWESLPLERQRMVVANTVTVIIDRSGRRGRGFDPDSVRIESCAIVGPQA